MKIRSVTAEFFHADGRTGGERHTTKTGVCRNFSNAPYKWCIPIQYTYKYILTYTKFDFINIRSAKYVHVHAYARVCVCVCVCAHAHTHTSAMNGPVAKFNKIFIFLTVVELNSRNLVS